MAQQPRIDVVPEQIWLDRLKRSLKPAPWVQIDHVRQRLERPAASQVIITGQPLGPIRIVPELHPLRALAWQDQTLAGLARRAAPPAAIRKLVVEEHATLQSCHRPPAPAARLPQADVRLVTRPLQRCVTPLVPASRPFMGRRMVKHISYLEDSQLSQRECPAEEIPEASGGDWLVIRFVPRETCSDAPWPQQRPIYSWSRSWKDHFGAWFGTISRPWPPAWPIGRIFAILLKIDPDASNHRGRFLSASAATLIMNHSFEP